MSKLDKAIEVIQSLQGKPWNYLESKKGEVIMSAVQLEQKLKIPENKVLRNWMAHGNCCAGTLLRATTDYTQCDLLRKIQIVACTGCGSPNCPKRSGVCPKCQ
jgi:hypothetical protein